MTWKTVATRLMVAYFAIALTGEGMAACRTCATKLVLNRAEWSCLKPRLAEYLRDTVDPVIASVLNCGAQVARVGEIVIFSIPDIRPQRSPDEPDVDTERMVFYLTKEQVQCMLGRIDALISASGDMPVETELAPCLPR
ncbi:MAG: hypothetical protein WCK65_14600 [Rhodospirillaceae bacterium]